LEGALEDGEDVGEIVGTEQGRDLRQDVARQFPVFDELGTKFSLEKKRLLKGNLGKKCEAFYSVCKKIFASEVSF
jgi:hypothetical protein